MLDNVVSYSKELYRTIALFLNSFPPRDRCISKMSRDPLQLLLLICKLSRNQISNQQVTEACVCVLLLCICCRLSRRGVACVNKQFPVKTEQHKCQDPGMTLLCKVSFTYLKEEDFNSEKVQRRTESMIRDGFCSKIRLQ